MKEITIVGAGLAGSLMALLLANRGYKVVVFEKRQDMRKAEISVGRSINLALSDRGISALKRAGIDQQILKEVMPMRGRLIHSINGEKSLQPYSGRDGEYINSVSRGGLNITLMNAAEATGNVTFEFEWGCKRIDFENNILTLENSQLDLRKENFDTIIGADGGGSYVRLAYQLGGIRRFNFSQQFLDHGYKELVIPPNEDGGFRIANDALHIWPRGTFMMIALPNLDGSFTCTLFMPFEGKNGFEYLDNEEKVQAFFEEFFPDALKHMPTLLQDFFNNPHDKLGTIKCFPWAIKDKSLLIGDAAHAVVPFYGQGMNASFEDCRILDELLEKHGEDFKTAYSEFEHLRKANADAIGDLAIQNYYEMRDHVAHKDYQIKREIELDLEKTTDYNSKYSLVTFRDDIGYAVAKKKGELQDELLLNLIDNNEHIGKSNKEILEILNKNIKI
ncbi:FAD-dependent monooxygenase [bacterium]|nr:MAG: FAD-dependent monooxygenase [bacterium]